MVKAGSGKVRGAEVPAFSSTRTSQVTVDLLFSVLARENLEKESSEPVVEGDDIKVSKPVGVGRYLTERSCCPCGFRG